MRPSGKIVKPLDTPRLSAASTGVAQQMGDVLNHAGATWEPRLLSNLYAAAAPAADDRYAEDHGLICQHYGIRQSDLAVIIELAEATLASRHSTEIEHTGRYDCPGCRLSLELGRVRSALNWTSAPGWGGG